MVLAALCTGVGDIVPKFDTYMPVRGVLEVSFCSFLGQLARKLDGSRTTGQDLLKFYQAVYPILAGGASASTSSAHAMGQCSTLRCVLTVPQEKRTRSAQNALWTHPQETLNTHVRKSGYIRGTINDWLVITF